MMSEHMTPLQEKYYRMGVMDFQRIIAGMQIPHAVKKEIVIQCRAALRTPHDTPSDVEQRKHHALLESRTLMDIHAAEAENRSASRAVLVVNRGKGAA
jgi:hypothetical protein